MGLFNKIKEPVFLKESSTAELQLKALEAFQGQVPEPPTKQLAQDIKRVVTGIEGEKAIAFELKNSHIPMFVLHDLMLSCGDLSAQIDYLIVTRKSCFLVECKKLYGNIQVNERGEFIRWISFQGGASRQEGIYSPVTQNKRHLELIKQIQGTLTNFLTKSKFERDFSARYRSIVVLANEKTVLNLQNAPAEIKDQVIRADQLVEYIRKTNEEAGVDAVSEKVMEETARFFLACHRENNTDYTSKYQKAVLEQLTEELDTQKKTKVAQETKASQKAKTSPEAKPLRKTKVASAPSKTAPLPKLPSKETEVLCPKCGAPMVLRTATKGANEGKSFYGCSRYPQCRSIVNVHE